ncbi:MAG TPA: DUF4396 domain-containing protein [Polyangia bacterium]|jgi:hypothetical protein
MFANVMATDLVTAAWISLAAAVACCGVVVIDLLIGHRQKMWVMNVVWPVTALWAGPLGLWGYWRYGRMPQRGRRDADGPSGHSRQPDQPFWALVMKATTHCGSGCALGDLAAESFAAAVPLTILGQTLFGAWIYDYVAAYLLGIAFQYYTIKPMRQLSWKASLVAAVKADTLSLTAWQLGMYGWMAVVRFTLFGRDLPKGSPLFWFMMQIAMVLGFATAYPVNWWLLRVGIKEKM